MDLEKLNLNIVKMTHAHTKEQVNHMNRGPKPGRLRLAHLVSLCQLSMKEKLGSKRRQKAGWKRVGAGLELEFIF